MCIFTIFQVVVALNKQPSNASGIAANIIGTMSVWATDTNNADVKIVTGKTFSLVVDVSGASSVSALSVPFASTSTSSALSVETHALKSAIGTRSSGSYLFCAKSSQSECTDADWKVKPCDSSTGCSIQGSKITISSASNFGVYAVRAVLASENEKSPACKVTVTLFAVIAVLIHIFI
jgi:hypothetical protein